MLRKTIYLLLATLALNVAPSTAANTAGKVPKWMDTSLAPEKRARLLLKAMTLDEKIGQMDMMSKWDEEKVTQTHGLHQGSGFGAWIGEVSPQEYNRLQRYSEASRLQIPYLIGNDAAHGDACKQGRTVFPTSITMAATFNPALVEEAARLSAAEIRASGNNWTFAPCIDIVHDARWGRTGETYGEDPCLTSVLVKAAVNGLQGNFDPQRNVAACAKHFLGGGVSIGGVNHGHAEIAPRTLRTDFLPPFEAAIGAGVATIMPGHNDVNGIPVHASRELLTDLVKGEYKFGGFFISDMGDVENLLKNRIHRTADTQKEAVRQAVDAGLDMHMYSWDADMFIGNVRQLYKEGKISLKRIEDAALRILTLKFRLGLFEQRYIDENSCAGRLRRPEALDAALRAARESVVLLTNRQGILPLDTTHYRRILVTGPNADNQNMLGDWASPQPAENVVTLLKGMQCEFPGCRIDFVPTGRIKGKRSDVTVETTDPVTQARRMEEGGELNDYDIRKAAEAAAGADLVVLAIGGQGLRTDWGHRTYGESADRPSIDFYGKQVELVRAVAATGKPFIVVINNGKPLNNPWITEHANAIIDAWEPGMYGGQAVAEVISGRTNPSGKLPITIPQHAGQIPMFYYQTQSRYTTGYGLGSSRADDKPAFAFGHGLSYTTFSCTDATPAGDTLLTQGRPYRLEVTVKNTGKRDGTHTVMLFVRDDVSSVVTALKRMAAFEKVYLKAGEEKRVTLEVPADAFKVWNRDMEFVAEPGTFTLSVGPASDQTYFTRRVCLEEKQQADVQKR